jgi:hypothetical protein
MTVYLEMAQRLRAEIDVAEAHIAKLKTALEGMQPLVTMDVEARELKKTPRLGMQLESKAPADAQLVEEVPAAEQAASDTVEPVAPKAKPKRKPRAVAAAEQPPAEAPVDAPAEPSAKPARKARVESGLPSTAGEFWAGVMGKRAHTSADAVDRAIKQLGVSEESRAVLGNRFSAWLYAAIKAGKAEQADMKGKLKRYKLTVTSE